MNSVFKQVDSELHRLLVDNLEDTPTRVGGWIWERVRNSVRVTLEEMSPGRLQWDLLHEVLPKRGQS